MKQKNCTIYVVLKLYNKNKNMGGPCSGVLSYFSVTKNMPWKLGLSQKLRCECVLIDSEPKKTLDYFR